MNRFKRAPGSWDHRRCVTKCRMGGAFDVDIERGSVTPRAEVDVSPRRCFNFVLHLAASEEESLGNETFRADRAHAIEAGLDVRIGV